MAVSGVGLTGSIGLQSNVNAFTSVSSDPVQQQQDSEQRRRQLEANDSSKRVSQLGSTSSVTPDRGNNLNISV